MLLCFTALVVNGALLLAQSRADDDADPVSRLEHRLPERAAGFDDRTSADIGRLASEIEQRAFRQSLFADGAGAEQILPAVRRLLILQDRVDAALRKTLDERLQFTN